MPPPAINFEVCRLTDGIDTPTGPRLAAQIEAELRKLPEAGEVTITFRRVPAPPIE